MVALEILVLFVWVQILAPELFGILNGITNQIYLLWDSITVMQRPVKSYYAGAEPAPTAFRNFMKEKKEKYITRKELRLDGRAV